MMGRARWRRWAIRCCRLLLFLFTLALGAGYRPPPGIGAPAGCGRAPVDLVLLLDDSGSMGKETDEQNDPDNLRITAAHLMLDLLDPGDRAGLVLFSDQLREASALTEVGVAGPALHSRINRFASRGGTRLDLALQAGLDQFPATPDRPRAILMLTDGRPDVDPAGQRARLLELARQAGRQQVALYVIGLGPNYDRPLLAEVTAESRSQQPWNVVKPEHLSSAFLEILRNLKGLNIETSTTGKVDLLGLSDEVRFATLRRQAEPPAEIVWPGGSLQGRPAPAQAAPGVTYGYDLVVYKPATAGPGTATAKAPVVWKIERPPVEARVLEPAPREAVAAGEETPVKIALSPCGAGMPEGLRAEVTVLDANRQTTPYSAVLKPEGADPRTLQGALKMAPDPGTYVLNVRILTADGRQAAVTEQTVTATLQHRWVVDAPRTLATGASGPVGVRHRFGGKPAPADDPGALQAAYPDGTVGAIALVAGAEPGLWTGRVTAPANQTGQIRYTLADGRATAATAVEPVRFVLDPPGPLSWSFLEARRGAPAAFALKGRTTGPVDGPGVIPPFVMTGGGTGTHGPWRPEGEGFTATATAHLQQSSAWPGVRDLFVGRDVPLTLAPQPGPYLEAAPVVVHARVRPLLAWYWALPLLMLLSVIGYGAWVRLFDGPQLPIAIGAAGGALVRLSGRRPGPLTRFFRTAAQREITVGGMASPARVKLQGLPADALLLVQSRGVPGLERFRIQNLNLKQPLVSHGLTRRRLSLKGRGPVPALSLGDIPLAIELHPINKRRR